MIKNNNTIAKIIFFYTLLCSSKSLNLRCGLYKQQQIKHKGKK